MKWEYLNTKYGERYFLRVGEVYVAKVTPSYRRHLVMSGYSAMTFSPISDPNDACEAFGGMVYSHKELAMDWCERAIRVDILPRIQLSEIEDLE